MGRILQTMGVGDTQQITIALWAKLDAADVLALPTPDGGGSYLVPLLEFGEYSEDNCYLPSGIWLQIPPDLSGIELIAAFSGRSNSVDYRDCLSDTWQDNANSPWTEEFSATPGPVNFGPGTYGNYTTQGTSWFVRSSISVSDASALQFGRWFFVFVSYDTSIDTVPEVDTVGPVIYDSAPLASCFLNANEQLFETGDTASKILPNFTTLSDLVPGGDFSTPSAIAAEASLLPGTFPWGVTADASGAGAFTPEPFPGGTPTLTVPGFEMMLSGGTVAIPGAFQPNAKISLSDVQVWVGQAIDGAANFGKFVTPVLGSYAIGGTPTDTSVAAAAFGPQTFLFKGGRNNFSINHGTAGPVTKIGTALDTAGPKF
jgi:hypothetical protein